MHKSKDQKRYEAIVRQLKTLKSDYKQGREIDQSQTTSIFQTLALFNINEYLVDGITSDPNLEAKIIDLCKKLTGRIKT